MLIPVETSFPVVGHLIMTVAIYRFLRRPRRRWRLLLALRRSRAQIRAGQVAVGDAPSYDVGQYADKPRAVVAGALVEAAHLLVNIPEQMERVNGNVGAFDRPLEQRPELFQTVGVDLPAHVFARVINHLMLIQLRELPLAILLGSVGIEVRPLLDVRYDMPANPALGQVLRDGRADATRLPILAALQETEDGSFVHAASPANDAVALGPVHELGLAADEGFVRLDCAFHLRPGPGLHGEPNTMEHEPTGFLRDAERPRQLVGADTVLAVGEHPERGQPLVEPDGAILKDRAKLDRELPPTVTALPDAAGLEEARVSRFARGTGRALRPAQRGQKGQAGVGVREVADRLSQRVREALEFGHATNLL